MRRRQLFATCEIVRFIQMKTTNFDLDPCFPGLMSSEKILEKN